MKNSCRFMALFATAVLAFAVHAQSYPTRPVRILIGTPAAGPGDVVTRGAAQALSQALGQPFVVENRVGADGIIAGEACARSAPDGYTLCMTDSFMVSVNPFVRASMPYDPARDLIPVIHYGFLGSAIVVHPSVPANSLRELFDLAKAKPGAVSWGSFGLSSASNLYIEWFKNAKGISFYNVPYKSASLVWPALLAGDVQIAYFSIAQQAASVKAGKAKALAVNTRSRSPLMPDVPTFKEAGMEVTIIAWFGLLAPAGTPGEIVRRVNAEIAKGLISGGPLKEKFLTSQGIEPDAPAGGSPEAFAEFLKYEREMYREVIRITGIRVQ